LKIIHFADLHIGVESYGRIDPATGLSSRLSDFLSALDQLVDYAIENKVDLIVFCGDAYKSREPSQTQQREFAKRINRLSTGGIPIFLLVGNHDLPNAIGRATTTEIFDALTVKNVYVASRPDIHTIPTHSGPIQIAALPWLRRSALLSNEQSKNLTIDQLNDKAREVLTNIITAKAAELDPALPSILAAHVWVTEARIGSERLMTIGQEHTLLVSNVANPAFDYVALGHIHRHQVLHESPPVVYAGSLERVDFSEAEDDKGFYVVDIEPEGEDGKRQVSYRFHPIKGRRFTTITAEIKPDDDDPTTTVLGEIARRRDDIADAVVRVSITLPAEAEGRLNHSEIRSALKDAYHLSIAREIQREARLRLGGQTAEEITPLDALKAYTEAKKLTPARAKLLLRYGEKLIREHDAKP